MLNTVYSVLPAVLVFLTNALYAWVWGGTRAEPLLGWMPWFTLISLQVLFFYPQRHPWEDAVMARQRVLGTIARDPLTWIALGFTVYLLIPLFNKGLCPGCDIAAIAAGADPRPPVPYLPWCVSTGEHARALMWFVPSLVAALAVRHSLLKRGRRMFVEMLAWNGALLAVYGFILAGIKAGGLYGGEAAKNSSHFFATFGYPNMGGSYFVFITAVSIGVWFQRWFDARRLIDATAKDVMKPRYVWIRAHYPLIAVAMNFFGALCTLSRAAIIASFVLILMAFLYILSGMFTKKRSDRIRSVKSAAWAALGMLVFLVLVYVFAPEGMSREVKSVSTLEVLDRVSGKGAYHSRVATAVFKDYPFFGVGNWGYRHLCRKYMTDEELKSIQLLGGANVHNDYLQFLCEFGAVGLLLLTAVFFFLVFPVVMEWYRFYRVSKFTRTENQPVTTFAVYSLPAPVFWTFTGVVFVFIHAFGDCPLRSGAVICALLTALAATEGFLPDGNHLPDTDEHDDDRHHHRHHRHHHHYH